MKVIAVIPAFQEATRIRESVLAILPYVDVGVVVDDGSEDETAKHARDAGAIVVRHRVNRGQGAALRTGNDAALRLGADIVVHIDADGQHDPASIPSIVAPLKDGMSDVVFGSRFLGVESVGMPLSRRILLHAARTFNAFVIGIPRLMTDPQSGYRAFSSCAAKEIDFRHDRMAHCSEILRLVTRSDLRWREVPVRVHYSKESLEKGQKPWNAASIAWQLFLGALMGR
jgi:glycosyltransferase involved in cell wall biosynthesis